MKAVLFIFLLAGGIFPFTAKESSSAINPQYERTDISEHYVILRVKYGLTKEGVTAKMIIDIGTSEDHPLYGQVANVEDEAIRVGDGTKVRVIQNEVDMLNHLADLGWEIVEIREIKILSSQYLQYLFKK